MNIPVNTQAGFGMMIPRIVSRLRQVGRRFFVLGCLGLLLPASVLAQVPDVGSVAPAITLPDQDGKTWRLADQRGHWVVLYFYPKDDTPGCTAEACNLRDNYAGLKKAGYEILGVSPDNEKSHTKFITKFELPFSLLADTEKATSEAYGVWIEKSMYGRKYMGVNRVTFIIDENGNIERIIDKVDTKDHTAQILGE